MELEFWHDKWAKNEIGFHLKQTHPLLVRYLDQVSPLENQTVFVPLCGKTLDIAYLLQQGYDVVANELSELAVQQLFQSLELTPAITQWEGGKLYTAPKLKVWAGDFFKLKVNDLPDIHWVYDRAALIALPEDMRGAYVEHLCTLTQHADQLLITLDYDQALMAGPPFSVLPDEVSARYGDGFAITSLSRKDIIGSEAKFAQRGLKTLFESAYLLKSD